MFCRPAHVFRSALAALLLFVAAAGAATAAEFATEPLSIRAADGSVKQFTVELAVTSEQRAQGLMFREDMAADRGMLFDFGGSRRVAMWMKNTYLPLDMVFIRADGTIARVAADRLPLSENIIDSGEPVHFVLELNGGAAARLAIAAGDKVESATIAAAATKP